MVDLVFHGSNEVVEKPRLIIDNNMHRDFGYGFYVTPNGAEAYMWADRLPASNIINAYEVDLLVLMNIP